MSYTVCMIYIGLINKTYKYTISSRIDNKIILDVYRYNDPFYYCQYRVGQLDLQNE